MPLQPGTRLGLYEITAAIGAGGPPSLNAAFGRSFGEVSPKPSWWKTR